MKKLHDETDSTSEAKLKNSLAVKETLKESINQSKTNTTVTIDINPIKYFEEFIPRFSRNPLELRDYITQKGNTFPEVPLHQTTGTAQISCACRTELTTWQTLKDRLITVY